MGASMTSTVTTLSQNLHVFTNTDALWSLSFFFCFQGGFITRSRWIKPLETNIQPFFSLDGGRTENSNPLITWLVLLATSLHP